VVGAAYPANALAVGVLNGSNIGRLVGDETSGLWVNIKAGAGSGGTALADAGTFTLTSTNMTPAGCTFNSGSLTLTTGTAGALSCTAGRSLHTTVDTVTNWAGGALGAMANYGTSPGAVLVPGVNAFVTNATALGQAAMAASSPVVIANNQSTLPVNTAQVNGVTVLTGTGATGTGAQRVTVSTDQATNAGAALVKGGVGVVNGGSFRQEVDASATATVLQQSTGAAGDYLSHCVIFPATTTPGVVQVFDNTNAGGNYAINFPGGASSVSNLAPIPIPIGAVSVAGAWKVTTTTNVSVVCYGRFS
jgi:hypothetical protein